MASSHVTLTLWVRDMDRTRQLVWELWMLLDEMRVMASPHAERLERVLLRFADGGDDDRPDEPLPSSS